jgi:hypothetical protein
MNRTRRSTIAGGLAVLATALTGCFPLITEDSASQQDPMSDVRVQTAGCATPLLALLIIGEAGGVESADDLCVDPQDAAEFYYSDFSELNIPLPGQALLSYRVPKGATAPEKLTVSSKVVHFTDWFEFLSSPGGGGGTGTGTTGERPDPPALRDVEITFTRSTQLDEHLPGHYARTNDDEPEDDEDGVDILADDEQLVSYVSDVVPGAMVGEWKITTPFGLPSGSRPYTGPFNHVSMAGWRAAIKPDLVPEGEDVRRLRAAGILRGSGPFGGFFGDLDPERPVDCRFIAIPNETEVRRAMRGEDPELDLTFCPMPELRINEGGQAVSVGNFKGTDTVTRDLGLRGSGETFVEQGRSATVPFSLVGAGPAGGKLDITATVSPAIAGVGAIKHEIDFPGTGTHARSVEVKVPADAPARTYEVLLTASRDGHQRTAKAGLVVLPKPEAAIPAAPAGTRAASKPLSRETVYMDRQGFIRFRSTCGTCAVDGLVPFGSVGATAKAAQATGKHRLLRVARGTVRGKAGARTAVKVKLFPKAQRALRKGRRLTGVIVFRKGASGTPQVRKVVFRTRRK